MSGASKRDAAKAIREVADALNEIANGFESSHVLLDYHKIEGPLKKARKIIGLIDDHVAKKKARETELLMLDEAERGAEGGEIKGMNRSEHKKLVADALQRLSDHALEVKALAEDETVEMTDERFYWGFNNLAKDAGKVKEIDRAARTIMRAESQTEKDITAPPQ